MLNTVGKRLKKARTDAKMTQKELADAVDAKQGAISDLENGRNNSSTKLVQMAIVLGVNPRWLSTGIGEERGGDVNFWRKDLSDEGIPVYQASAIKSLLDNEFIMPVGYEPCPVGVNKDGYFWALIDDNSMSPEFKLNDRVMFSPKYVPTPGTFVIAILDDYEESVFRRWRPMGYDPITDDEYYWLEAINSNYPHIDSRHTKFSTYAVAMTHKRDLIVF
jgi:transcriptional regulator with XRE-family HTH domain